MVVMDIIVGAGTGTIVVVVRVVVMVGSGAVEVPKDCRASYVDG